MAGATLTTQDMARRLERSDILLTRGRGLMASLIRWATHSHWNHAALVYVLSDDASGEKLGYRRTFIIEAETHGIDIHPIDKYLYNEGQDMVVLRLPPDVLPAGIRPDYLRRVRGFALEEIDAGYGFSEIGGIVRRIFTWVGAPFAALFARASLLFRTPGVARVVNRWICSGIAQYAYYRACFAADPSGKQYPHFNDPAAIAKIVFSPDARTSIANGMSYDQAIEELKLTTPAQFAQAAAFGSLQVVGQRIRGQWQDRLTRP
ncbi:MAG: hypothetical protein HY681_04445 [Chloroflexi bacterium]|nr:hypothetical protein [Chloroflexota bacterium]